MFDKIKQYYNDGLWSIERVRKMVELRKITKDEFEIITEKKYEE